jgi:hypothetical protein
VQAVQLTFYSTPPMLQQHLVAWHLQEGHQQQQQQQQQQ